MDSSKFDTIRDLIKDQRLRFLIVGGINTVVGYSTFAAFLLIEWHYLVANFIATAAGVIVSYFLNKYFTFGHYKNSFSEIMRFISVYFINSIIEFKNKFHLSFIGSIFDYTIFIF